MSTLKQFLVQGAVIVGIMLSPTSASIPLSAANVKQYAYTLDQVVVTAKKVKRKTSKEFLGFKLQKGLDTSVHSKLEDALKDFKSSNAPEVVISSLKRHKWNIRSKHRAGKAVDFEFSHELIVWLVSEEGTAWRTKHNVTFYIEDRPNSKVLKPYLQDNKYSQFVYENPNATGDHIHINI